MAEKCPWKYGKNLSIRTERFDFFFCLGGGGGVEIPTQIEQLNFSLAALERQLRLHELNYISFQLSMLLSQCKRNFNANFLSSLLFCHCAHPCCYLFGLCIVL